MDYIKQFVSLNSKILLAMLIGCILGYVYWYYLGCYWGLYPLSSECWVNSSIGGLFSGFIVSLFNE